MNHHSRSRLARVAARFTSPADVALAVRIMMWACVLPLLKHLLPIQPLVKVVWRSPRLAPDAVRDDRVVTFARWACRLTRWRSGGNCLERGLIAYRFLLEGSAAPTLVVGVGKGNVGEILGHAWVLIDDRPAGESVGSLQRFSPVFAFGPDGALIRSVPQSGTHHRPTDRPPELSPDIPDPVR